MLNGGGTDSFKENARMKSSSLTQFLWSMRNFRSDNTEHRPESFWVRTQLIPLLFKFSVVGCRRVALPEQTIDPSLVEKTVEIPDLRLTGVCKCHIEKRDTNMVDKSQNTIIAASPI